MGVGVLGLGLLIVFLLLLVFIEVIWGGRNEEVVIVVEVVKEYVKGVVWNIVDVVSNVGEGFGF